MDKANDLKDKAGSAASAAQGKAGDMAGKLSPDAKAKIDKALGDHMSPEAKKKLDAALAKGGVSLDAGKNADKPGASTVEAYFAARQAAMTDGDLSTLKSVSTPAMFKKAKKQVKRLGPKQKGKDFQVKIVTVKGNTSQVCIGLKGTNPKAVTVKKNKVAKIAKGTAKCA